MVVDIVVLSCRASCLKSLRLISCLGVSNEGIEEAIKQFPLLEELELSFCDNVTYKAYAIIGVTCGPQLKCLKLIKSFFDGWGGNEDVWVIKNMHELTPCSSLPIPSLIKVYQLSWITAPTWNLLTYAIAIMSTWTPPCEQNVPGSRYWGHLMTMTSIVCVLLGGSPSPRPLFSLDGSPPPGPLLSLDFFYKINHRWERFPT